MKWILGDYMPQGEQLDIEYKEFCFKWLLPDTPHSQSYIETGILDDAFYSHVERNLDFYFKEYLPKYITIFGNSPIHHGKLFIGVNDEGQITGIPYHRQWTTQELQQRIETILNECVLTSTGEPVKWSVKVHSLSIDSALIQDGLDEKLDTIDKTQILYTDYLNQFRKTRQDWVRQLEHYKRKIRVITNDTRERRNIVQWMKDSGCESDIAIQSLTHNQYIKGITTDWILQNKSNPDHPMYWVTRYRDYWVQGLLKRKPYWRPPSHLRLFSRIQLLNIVTPMRKKWLEKNSGLGYYMLEFQIAGRQQYSQDTIVYYRPLSKLEKNFCYISKKTNNSPTSQWKTRMRGISPSGDPKCVEFE